MNTKTDIKKLASKHGTCTRTIRRWIAAGAPLNDPKKLRQWLAGRKHRPASQDMGHRGPVPPVTPTAPLVVTSKDATGAAYALGRLEAAEAEAFREYDAARRAQDPVRLKLASQQWLSIVYELRLCDKQIETSRRAEGELIERKDVLQSLSLFASLLHMSAVRVANEAAVNLAGTESVVQCRVKLRELLFEGWMQALVASRTTVGRNIPGWMFDAFEEQLGQSYRNVASQVAERAGEFGEIIDKSVEYLLWDLDERDRNWRWYRDHGIDAPRPPGEVPPWERPATTAV
jgi:hypothetical protein